MGNFIFASRSRHPRVPAAALQEAQADTNSLQPQSVAEAGTRVREKPLRRRRREETTRAVP